MADHCRERMKREGENDKNVIMLKLEDFKSIELKNCQTVIGARNGRIDWSGTIDGVSSVDLEWDSGHQDCGVSLSDLGWSGWDDKGADPYTGRDF